MVEIPRSDEIPTSKRKNLALTGSIVSLFFMPNNLSAQTPQKISTPHHSNTKYEMQQTIDIKSQVRPLSFAKKNVQKYFPERTTCFKEIISTIEQDPILSYRINTILDKTIMRPRVVHKETKRRPRTEKDITGAILLFLEGTLGRNDFAFSIDQKDGADILNTDTTTYTTRLKILDRAEIAPEMVQAVLDADDMFAYWEDIQLQ